MAFNMALIGDTIDISGDGLITIDFDPLMAPSIVQVALIE